MTAGQVVAVTANQGTNLIFSVFAAAVIGGVSLDGGRGRIQVRSPASSTWHWSRAS
jgi:ribose/xylose/arabinose/galactoside ABC-type transport system permease subunit